ncbi:hypothetical protein [uncultured Jatrophihabitans sp.]|uniref:hypothetical protein n=1 Tax=uncultured Jatrophihabitans sp. TaxID=1610747 RepID=UPI0035CAA203
MNFESFSRQMLTSNAEPHVTIHKRGTLSLNRPAYEAIGSPASVELLFDRGAQIVGLRGVPHDVANAYHVRASTPSPSGPWVISAIAFTKYYDIDTTRSLRWPAHVQDGILCVDLTSAAVPVTSNRARNDAP